MATETFTALLAAHPSAWIGAVNRGGRYVPVPAAVPTDGHPILHGTWALDHVVHADRVALADAWRSRVGGSASTEARLVTGGVVQFHIFDTSGRYGVDLIVAIPDGDADLRAVAAADVEDMPSRFCRLLRDETGRTIEIDTAAPKVLRYPAEELLSGKPAMERIHPDSHPVLLANWMATLANETDGHRCRVRVIRGDGTLAWFEITHFNRLDDPERPHVVSEMLDITEEMAAHEALAAREQLLDRLTEALPLGVAQVDTMRELVYANDRLHEVLAVDHATDVGSLFDAVTASDREIVSAAFDASLDRGDDTDVVAHLRTGRIVQITTRSLRGIDGAVTGAVACVADITDAAVMGRELERRATFDALTGCLNRATILARLDDALSDGAGGSAVIFLDLDGFKSVNDRCGHAVGDAVLRAAAGVLDRSTRDTDDVGRLGGDEFLVVCRDVADADEAMRLAARISASLRDHPMVAGAHVPLRASIGVAWAPRGSTTADTLVARADAAMYESKRAAAGLPISA